MRLRFVILPLALGLAFALPSVCLADTITGVTFTGSAAAPTITITGTGFGSTAPPTSDPAVGTGFNYGTSLYLDDNSMGFSTGYEDLSAGRYDYIGLVLLSYSDTSITYGLGSNYQTGYDLASGDAYTAGVLGTTFTGTVVYAVTPSPVPEPSGLALLGTGLSCIAGLLGSARRRMLKA